MAELDATQLLEQLRDIHQPAPPPEPSLWPIALALLIIGIAITTLIVRYRKKQQRSWGSAAIRELDLIQRHPDSTAHLKTATLLKRIVLTHNNQTALKKIHGTAWLHYLDRFFNTRFFSEGDGQIFGDNLYQQNSADQIEPTINYKQLRKLIRQRSWQS